MKIFLLRHEMRYICPQFDTELTELGKKNASKLVDILKVLNINIVISSPFIRTIQTIDPFIKENKLSINVDYALYESLQDINIFDFSDIREINTKLYGWDYFDKSYKSSININDLQIGESTNDIKNRTNILISKLLNDKELQNTNILLVSHQTPVCTMLKLDNYNYPMGGLCKFYDSLLDDNFCFEPINFTK